MPKYLFRASYTAEGARGLMKEGGTKRRAVVEQVAKSVGATLEAFYFAFGADDAYVVVDAPDHAAAVATSMAVNASGAVRLTTVVLLSPEEIDQASKRTVKYRAPGAKKN